MLLQSTDGFEAICITVLFFQCCFNLPTALRRYICITVLFFQCCFNRPTALRRYICITVLFFQCCFNRPTALRRYICITVLFFQCCFNRPTALSVCCVFFPFILDIKFVGRTSRGHTGGRPHRISHPPSFCGACLNFSRGKDSAIPFPRRP